MGWSQQLLGCDAHANALRKRAFEVGTQVHPNNAWRHQSKHSLCKEADLPGEQRGSADTDRTEHAWQEGVGQFEPYHKDDWREGVHVHMNACMQSETARAAHKENARGFYGVLMCACFAAAC